MPPLPSLSAAEFVTLDAARFAACPASSAASKNCMYTNVADVAPTTDVTFPYRFARTNSRYSGIDCNEEKAKTLQHHGAD